MTIISHHRQALVAIAEAIEAGDTDLAHELALSALENRATVDRDDRRRDCDKCGAGPFWPGELADHERRLHESLPPRPRRGSVRIHPPARLGGTADRTRR